MTKKRVNFDLTPFVDSLILDFTDNRLSFVTETIYDRLVKDLPNHDIEYKAVRDCIKDIMNSDDYKATYKESVMYSFQGDIASVKTEGTTNCTSKNRNAIEQDSSFITGASFLETDNIAIICMASGVYAYKDIPKDIFNEFLFSKSKGYRSFI